MDEQKQPQMTPAVINGKSVNINTSPVPVATKKVRENKIVYLVGFALRTAGILGVLHVLVMLSNSGPLFLIILFVYWQVTIPSLLAIAVGHYMASNWKPQGWRLNAHDKEHR
ncbi:MAG: hypothetical protein ACREGB_04500 [Candidatus Saccharimonadales bacterium]